MCNNGSVDFEHPFEPVSNDLPGLPDKYLNRVAALYKEGPSRISLERRHGKKSWQQFNVLTPTRDQSGALTEDSFAIAVAIYQAAEWDAEEEGNSEQRYRAKFWVMDDKGNELRKVVGFSVDVDAGEVNAAGDGRGDESDDLTVLSVVLGEFRGLLSIQSAQIEQQGQMILQLSRNAQMQTAPLLTLIETLVGHYHTGINMQANALSTVFDIQRQQNIDQAQAVNSGKLWDLLTLAGPEVAKQFGAFLGLRAGATLPGAAPAEMPRLPSAHHASIDRMREAIQGKQGAPAAGAPATVQQVAQGGAVTVVPPNFNAAATPAPPPPSADDPIVAADAEKARRDQEERPFTLMAEYLQLTIEAKQWMDLAETLTKKQFKLLKSAFTQKEDPETMQAVWEFKEALMKAPTTFAAVKEILNEDQGKLILALIEGLGKAEAKGEFTPKR